MNNQSPVIIHYIFVFFLYIIRIAANGGVEADVCHRVNEGCKVLGALKGVMRNRRLGMNVKKVLYEKVVVPTVMYGSESWGIIIIIIIIIITFKTANPNWESQMPKTQRPQQGRQPSKERENFRKKRKQR